MNKFTIHSLDNGTLDIAEIANFPGGEVRVKLKAGHHLPSAVRIEAYLFNSNDIITLIMLVDAIRNMRNRIERVERIRLTMPYIPYARQDRVCAEGEAFSMKVFAKLINSLDFASIVVWDAHSDVSVALLDRVINVERWRLMAQHNELMKWLNLGGEKAYLLSPDAGAVKKSYDTVKNMPDVFKGIIFAEKIRDPNTGKILRTHIAELPDDIATSKVIVADDLIDGGRTFLEIANWFTDVEGRPKPKEIALYATHGIFSQGKTVFNGLFSHVWSTVDFTDYK